MKRLNDFWTTMQCKELPLGSRDRVSSDFQYGRRERHSHDAAKFS